MTPAERAALEALLETGDRQIEQAFLEAISDVANRAQISRITEALRRGRYDQAIDALGINEEAFDVVSEAIRKAYLDAGNTQSTFIGASRAASGYEAVFRFNARNRAAERWLSEHSAQFVTRTTREQQTVMREALRAGMEAGRNPRDVALEIAGRLPRGANSRTGGLVGLTEQQAQWGMTARAELESGDPAQLKNYLRREKRDRRFDATVRKAIETGKPIPKDKIETMTARYNDRLLKLRADTIARTESLQSLNAARYAAYEQAIQNGVVAPGLIKKRWKDSRDGRVRLSHIAMHNKEASFGEAFTTPLGSRLQYPGDTSLGAQPADIIQCRCLVEYRIDFAKGIQ